MKPFLPPHVKAAKLAEIYKTQTKPIIRGLYRDLLKTSRKLFLNTDPQAAVFFTIQQQV
jgi:hypothetical protein